MKRYLILIVAVILAMGIILGGSWDCDDENDGNT